MKFQVEKEGQEVVISGTSEDGKLRTLRLPRKLYEAVESLKHPTPNGEVQILLAKAMGISAPGGRSSRAASFLERNTYGYGAFNGWCSLFLASQEGKKRFFQFNAELGISEDQKAGMLTKNEKKEGNDIKAVRHGEDLDVPDNYIISAQEMNAIIDRAYIALGFNPKKLTEEAPDLSFEEAVVILEEKGA